MLFRSLVSGHRWFEQRNDFVATPSPAPRRNPDEVPELFTRCPGCNEPAYREVLVEFLDVCPGCGHHFRMDAEARVTMLMDNDCEQERHDTHIRSVDALGFRDSKTYPDRIRAADKKTGRNDAFLSVSGTIESIPVELGVMDFAYMGGSMGSVVGEMLTRLYERALERKRPAIVVCASGGARMQEGVLSLMQMAKTSAALARLQNVGRMPYISILTHPTTGGVAASFAMLGDVIVAEPKALIGFAGARVIEQTIGQQLPEGFQTAEYLLDTGMVDRIVPRDELRASVAKILRMLLNQPSTGLVEVDSEPA